MGGNRAVVNIYIYTFFNNITCRMAFLFDRAITNLPLLPHLTHGYPAPEVGNDCEDFDQYGWTQVRGWALTAFECK